MCSRFIQKPYTTSPLAFAQHYQHWSRLLCAGLHSFDPFRSRGRDFKPLIRSFRAPKFVFLQMFASKVHPVCLSVSNITMQVHNHQNEQQVIYSKMKSDCNWKSCLIVLAICRRSRYKLNEDKTGVSSSITWVVSNPVNAFDWFPKMTDDLRWRYLKYLERLLTPESTVSILWTSRSSWSSP